MNRKPKLTKRERKAAEPKPAPAANAKHIHCTACGAHLDPAELSAGTATLVRCKHGSTFASCAGCVPTTRRLLDEHDRTGQAVKSAPAWH